ncbi:MULTISPECIES: GntR family transcriptional regulator [Thalassospira]|uniref:GntR family transcriptional regulator n=1 Tax=Thalassospira TaxID=168934 RepID=UPI0008DE3D32|nr:MULTISPECIES: GntR family transcriptional regulator [Thalassospira]MAB35122.1 GntR family transcriptional regulator [Thalassospira sp.]MBA06767.1 GntR family transcriptional regulator [Thalassospira sp.]MDM7977559.1 GntR family transcriptional regulator [Thalassospira xiamenensis]OHZ04675.1 GntR family transcriptional regulator [Thalassospira sp. MIT1004]HBS25263.1 GntR family transcriptional regulator [Thalassospira sp.]|tara:strand:+ start:465 stop:1118 length:654 start_codon:yes stop_codon:yes gene_type:complete
MSSSTVAETVYNEIRDDILYGELQPGVKLKLDALRDRYNAGVNTLREVLNRLVASGFVFVEGQKGFRVVETSPSNFKELTAMRLLLETNGLAKSIDAGDVEWEGRVAAAHHKLSAIEKRMLTEESRELTVRWSQYDREFHQALISACGSDLHLRMHREIFDQFRRYVVIELKTHGFRAEEIIDEHRGICDLALARDKTAALAKLTDHIETYRRRSQD